MLDISTARFADTTREILNFPFAYQAVALVCFALFLLFFSVARDPRSWRRLYQAFFSRKEEFSVNRNKRFDELIKKYSIWVSMLFLVICATSLILGATHKRRLEAREISREEKILRDDVRRVQGY